MRYATIKKHMIERDRSFPAAKTCFASVLPMKQTKKKRKKRKKKIKSRK